MFPLRCPIWMRALKALVIAKHNESVQQNEQLTSKAHEIEHPRQEGSSERLQSDEAESGILGRVPAS
jgi:hypothetical protein